MCTSSGNISFQVATISGRNSVRLVGVGWLDEMNWLRGKNRPKLRVRNGPHRNVRVVGDWARLAPGHEQRRSEVVELRFEVGVSSGIEHLRFSRSG